MGPILGVKRVPGASWGQESRLRHNPCMSDHREQQYFIIRSNEDGTKIDGPMDKETVLLRIKPNAEGETYYGALKGFHSRVPNSSDGYWASGDEDKILVIEGHIVMPQAKVVTTVYELE